MPSATPLPLRQMICRHLQRGLTAAAIARALGLSPSTVRGLARRFRGPDAPRLAPDYHRGGRAAVGRPPLADEAVRLRQEHDTWGAGYLRARHSDAALPSTRTVQRWLARAGLGPAPAGRPPLAEAPRAQAPHQRWQLDAVEQLPLATGAMVSWLRAVDEFTGAVLETVVLCPSGGSRS